MFNCSDVEIEFLLNKQSADIALGVDSADRKGEGAGDQGIMFGYACGETKELMPASLLYSHKILRNIYASQNRGEISGFGPDSKSQITLEYDENGVATRLDTVLVSIQHDPHLTLEDIEKQIKPVVLDTIPDPLIKKEIRFLFNPTGKFVIGGPESDTGLTGRKIIVDTYGGAAPHGGGAFSGKDATKVDRSAAYIARYLAKNIVAASLADKCLIQLSYAIGISEPVSIYVNSYGSSKMSEAAIVKLIRRHVDLTPKGIRDFLSLDKPIYLPTATYGHFGRQHKDSLFSWEKIDLAAKL